MLYLAVKIKGKKHLSVLLTDKYLSIFWFFEWFFFNHKNFKNATNNFFNCHLDKKYFCLKIINVEVHEKDFIYKYMFVDNNKDISSGK